MREKTLLERILKGLADVLFVTAIGIVVVLLSLFFLVEIIQRTLPGI